jgi:hypothetical protein
MQLEEIEMKRSQHGFPGSSILVRLRSARYVTWPAPCGERLRPTGEHEKRIGQADANWPDWYAAYVRAEASGAKLPK